MTSTTINIKQQRDDTIAALRTRDGALCAFPDCGKQMDFSVKDGPLEVTIDHWFPQHFGKSENWTYEEIWALSNLKLMHKRCNAKKGDRIPNEDGTLPERTVRKFRYRRDKRATRAGLCSVCNNGHELAFDEICASCGGNAQAFPRWAKVKYNECDHELLWCPWCSIGVVERKASSIATAMRQMDSDELGEMFDPEWEG